MRSNGEVPPVAGRVGDGEDGGSYRGTEVGPHRLLPGLRMGLVYVSGSYIAGVTKQGDLLQLVWFDPMECRDPVSEVDLAGIRLL